MTLRIEIGLKAGIPDARGALVVQKARTFLGLAITRCRVRDVYKVDVPLTKRQDKEIREAFTDPVVNRSATGRLKAPPFDWLIEIGFKPGVTDNVGRTARSVVADMLGRKLAPGEDVYTSAQYFLTAPGLTRENVKALAWDLLANRLIQTADIFSESEWNSSPVDTSVPAIRERPRIEVQTVDLGGSDEALMKISREGILSLSLAEMHAIRDHYLDPAVRGRREALGLPEWPTDIELECIAQTWSEHCKHKIFAAEVRYDDGSGEIQTITSLYKTYIQAATRKVAEQVDWLVSVFSDNAGVIRFNDHLNVVIKAETHNSPSALDPYGGSITGIVGVNRDPLGTGIGAELLYNTWGYCLGSPFYDGDLPEGLMHPRRIRDGVHHGVIDGGNQSGIPWVRGFECFDDRFIGKPLVFCGTIGRMPRLINGKPSHEKEVLPGDRVVMAGGRIGKDGIHGATFSSVELRQESPAQAVQIGDPITQRKLYEFLMEARDAGLYRTLTDNGAGGLSSSIGEMCRMSGGATLDLSKAPLKYQGLQPWEVFLSEAQERMSLAVSPDTLDELIALAERRDVELSVLGTFTDDGRLTLTWGDKLTGILDLDFLHDGCPRMVIEARWTPPHIATPAPAGSGSRSKLLEALLGDLDVCSREYKSRSYDSEVKGLSVVKPYVGVEADVPSDATVCRVTLDSHEGLVIAEGINPFYSDLDTYWMTAAVVDEAVRRIISAGGRPGTIAGLDNFCWPDPVQSEKTPDGAYKMAQLVRANQALYDICTGLNVPLVSGKDSMKNDSTRGGRKISIPPTLLFTAMGKIDDVRSAVTLSFKQPGDDLWLVGLTKDEVGASAFHRMLAKTQGTPDSVGGNVPTYDLETAKRTYAAVAQAIREDLLNASHALTRGGLAIGASLCGLGGNLGAEIDPATIPVSSRLTKDALLFSESTGRFLVSSSPENRERLECLFADLPTARIGKVTETPTIKIGKWIQRDLTRLRKMFKSPLHGV
ncbi:MAG: phosphoribosylformylglycinamidine synthase [Kiritimatiellae bacterium]|nr:phosphoribosylformylglycinamidine synthase [Kiritimatiellia bacterium]